MSVNEDTVRSTHEDFQLPDIPTHSTPKKQRIVTDSQTSPALFTSSADMAVSPIKQIQLPTLNETLSKQSSDPLTKLEERVATALTKRKQNTSKEKDVLAFKTGGQPITYVRITKARKQSSKSMTARRTRTIELAKATTTGTDRGDLSALHKKERNRMDSSMQEKLESSKQTVINEKVGVAIKTLCGMSQNQFRAQRRLLKEANIVFKGEKKQNSQENELQPDIEIKHHDLTVKSETTVSGQELQQTPCVYISNLQQFVTDLLDKFHEQNLLTHHDNNIPADEIWIKVGGDHGGDSFKMSLQIANIESPNSKHNTYMICMAPAKDTRYNLREILSTYRKDIQALANLTWRGKKLKLFIFGDYEFLCNLYGLSGAAGKHPCLYCKTTQDRMQTTPEIAPESRTRRGILRDYWAFKRDNGPTTNKAIRHTNVIRCPVFQIELEQVCPPYLHIVLGVVKKHHTLLEEQCHQLDERLGQFLADQAYEADTSTHFGRFVEQKRLGHSTELPKRAGPICKEIDKSLKRNKIDVQAYHGRAFNGNHCNRYLKMYGDIVFSPVRIVQSLARTNNPLVLEAFKVCNIHEDLNHYFSEVHRLIGHDHPIDPSRIDSVQKAIDRYMSFYRKALPSSKVMPKQHILESHCIPFIQRTKFGLGLMGEQGGEQLHASINVLNRRFCAVRRPEKKLELIMKRHHLQVSPLLRQYMARKYKA
jgi:hypothetical protein